jgi:hypothetical protein
MLPVKNLRQRIGQGQAGRFLQGVDRGIRLADLVGSTSLGGRRAELAGGSVLLMARDQLAAAMALIELDGVARRLVLCPPDVPAQHLAAIVADAEVDAVVSDCDRTEHMPDGIPHLVADCRLDRAENPPRQTWRTEWLLLTSGTTGVPKLVSHDLASLTAPIRPTDEPPIWGTSYDIRRYGGLQIFLRALTCGGSLVLSCAGEPVDMCRARPPIGGAFS